MAKDIRDDLPDGGKESDSEYNGFLSYAAEWHAFTHGIFMGLTTHPLQTPPTPDNRDVKKESHYYRGGYIIGTLIQVLIIILLGGAAATGTGILPL